MDQKNLDFVRKCLLDSPPGELEQILSDLRFIINNDGLIQDTVLKAYEDYAQENFTPAVFPDSGDKVVMSKYNVVERGKYVDPKSGRMFTFDFLKKEVISISEPSNSESPNEKLRAAIEEKILNYVTNHYPTASCSVCHYEGNIVILISATKLSPNNFWNGSWRSMWSYNPKNKEAKGEMKLNVHYYEDGNVQLKSNKCPKITARGNQENAIADSLVEGIKSAESAYQEGVRMAYVDLAENTFKSLRRNLPITRNKIDWDKIANYKIGAEISGQSNE